MAASSSLFLCCLISSVAAKHVMFMPLPITSHAVNHVKLARAVADLGHEVTLVLSSVVVSKGGFDTTGFRLIQFPSMNFDDDVVYSALLEPLYAGQEQNIDLLVERCLEMHFEILANEALFKEMKASKPDLFVFDEDAAGTWMFAIFAYRMGVPFAAVDFTFEPYNRRVPFSPAVTPSYLLPFQQHMTFGERFGNTLFYLMKLAKDPFYRGDVVARFAPEMPYISLGSLLGRAEIWLVQSDHILDYPKPTLPNVKMIGALAACRPKPLPRHIQNFMDNAKDGVVIVAFGSLFHSVPSEVGEDVFMKAFQSLTKFKVIFRSNMTSPDPERIMTSLWIPQNDLLAHPNTVVFLTHCGMSSQYQGLYHGVPMVGIPFFYDQFYNAERLRARGFGRVLQFSQLTASQLVETIRDVATNPHYRQNIQRASKLYREQYGEPAKTAAYWLDHVMQHGGDYYEVSGSADGALPVSASGRHGRHGWSCLSLSDRLLPSVALSVPMFL